jgi:hypothetical protein
MREKREGGLLGGRFALPRDTAMTMLGVGTNVE